MDCVIENLRGCQVHLLDYTQQVTVDDCVDCSIIIGMSEVANGLTNIINNNIIYILSLSLKGPAMGPYS